MVEQDSGGVLNPKGFRARLQAKLSKSNAENIAKPTAAELKELESGHH
jgi:ubiquinol-cytochrome c reductase cytochrome b subunit